LKSEGVEMLSSSTFSQWVFRKLEQAPSRETFFSSVRFHWSG
jgi:hypothetical protein